MDLTVHVPDAIADRLKAQAAQPDDLTRRVLEGFALEEFRAGRLTKPELRELLGYETREALDGFLKAHAIFEHYTHEDLEQERRDLRRLGL